MLIFLDNECLSTKYKLGRNILIYLNISKFMKLIIIVPLLLKTFFTDENDGSKVETEVSMLPANPTKYFFTD